MQRLQRLKTTAALRDLVAEVGFGQSQLVQPLFVVEGLAGPEPVPGLGTVRPEPTAMRSGDAR